MTRSMLILGMFIAATAACTLSATLSLHRHIQAVQTQGDLPMSLPAPSGPFAIGRVTIDFTDRTRVEPLDPDERSRELMVDVWYPADSATGPPAAYFDANAFNDPQIAERLRRYFRSAYSGIQTGLVRTHAIDRAPFARSVKRSPLLIFSHGGGEARETYTVQMEDLASHGYVVAAITHTYDAVMARFPDGRNVVLAPQRWPPYEESLLEGTPVFPAANPAEWQWWAEDIRFVLNELSRNNSTESSTFPFVGRLDLSKVGAFGHSAGGFAAATSCQLEKRIKACLNQDGLSGRAPYHLDATGWGMDQAFMLIMRETPTGLPPDAELTTMGLTRSQALELVTRMDARQDAALRNTGKGSYRVVLQSNGTTHSDFGDLPFLQSRDLIEAQTRARLLRVISNLTRAFFDQNLRGMKSRMLGAGQASEFVRAVEKFEARRRPLVSK